MLLHFRQVATLDALVSQERFAIGWIRKDQLRVVRAVPNQDRRGRRSELEELVIAQVSNIASSRARNDDIHGAHGGDEVGEGKWFCFHDCASWQRPAP